LFFAKNFFIFLFKRREMKQLKTYTGKIVFDPPDKTKKHILQSDWKKVAIVELGGDLCAYYAWFLNKRFNLILNLNNNIREPHVTFINDSRRDISNANGGISNDRVDYLWEQLKSKWDGKQIDVTLNLHPATNNKHWWLVVDFDHREELHKIRAEIGLQKPFFGLHMTIGTSHPKWIDHSKYIARVAQDEVFYSAEKDEEI
jgi:hypothetical protein